jgi:hypothetical protein
LGALVLVIVVVALAYFLYTAHRARTQSKNVSEIQRIGGDVYYDYHYATVDGSLDPDASPPGPSWLRSILGRDFFSDVVDIDLPPEMVDDHLLGNLCDFPRLSSLGVGPAVTDNGLRDLRRLKQIEFLSLTGPAVNDDHMEYLSTLKRLHSLWLEDTDVTGDGLRHLAKLSDLDNLSLSRSAIDDNGMKSVGRLQHLRSLDLNGTRITDLGLKELSNLTKLRLLRVLDTDVTANGIRRLHEHLPNCGIDTFEDWEEEDARGAE